MNNLKWPCIFNKRSKARFVIIVVIDSNFIKTPKELTRTTRYLKMNSR